MTWHIDRLPIAVAPQPGEALDSWLESYAWRLNTDSHSLLTHLGISGQQLNRMLLRLTAPERSALSAATGISNEQLAAMTLDRFDTIAVNIDGQHRNLQHPPAWRRQKGTRYCPECLSETAGRWQLAWRLSWTAVCPLHHRLLADTCPRCQRRPSPHRSRDDMAEPGRCLRPSKEAAGGGKHKPSCGYPLTAAVTPALPPRGLIMTCAAWLTQLINTAAAKPQTASSTRVTLAELFLLAGRALAALHNNAGAAPPAARRVMKEAGNVVPPPFSPLATTSAHTVAVAATLAVLAHQQHLADSDRLLSWICLHGNGLTSPEPNMLVSRWRTCGTDLMRRILPHLDSKLSTGSRLRHQSRGRAPAMPGLADPARRAASIPALLWPNWTLRLLPRTHLASTGASTFQAGLAIMTLLPGSRISHRAAAAHLGNHCRQKTFSGLLSRLGPDADAVIIALGQLANHLDTSPAPINYQRRRALFSTPALSVSARRYARLALAYGWSANTRGGKPHPLQLSLINQHLARLLTGAPPLAAPGDARRSFNPLAIALPAAAWIMVHDEAKRILRQHQISEPVTWTPDLPPAVAQQLPGIDPQTINREAITQALQRFATHARTLGHLARACGLPPGQLRIYLQTAELAIPDELWAHLTVSAPASGSTGEHTIIDLYQQQRMPLHHIAQRTMQTESHIRKTLTSQGITLPRTRPRTIGITPQWFTENYLHTGLTGRQAAAKAGCSVNTLRKYAQQHNIAYGATAEPTNPFARWKTQPPPAVLAAAALHDGLHHLHIVAETAKHKTQRRAATALGLTERQVSRTKLLIEQATGITIFKPASGYLIPTPEGEHFLHHAAKALRRLQRQAKTST